MGLSNNLAYNATKHFKERLYERYAIVPSSWKSFMKTVYGDLRRDDQKTTAYQESLAANGRGKQENIQIYHSEIHKCYVVVDTKNLKLITIFEDPDNIENSIMQLIENEETVDTTQEEIEVDVEPNPLQEFAEQLKAEQEELVRKHKYKYAQRVIQENQEVFENFTKAYEKILTGSATTKNREFLYQLYDIKEKLDEIFPTMRINFK